MIGAFFLYAATIVITMFSLNYVSSSPNPWLNKLIYTGSGGVVGGVSSYFLQGSTGMASLVEHGIKGNFGYAGYAFVASILFLFGVWFYNFFVYDGVAIR